MNGRVFSQLGESHQQVHVLLCPFMVLQLVKQSELKSVSGINFYTFLHL